MGFACHSHLFGKDSANRVQHSRAGTESDAEMPPILAFTMQRYGEYLEIPLSCSVFLCIFGGDVFFLPIGFVGGLLVVYAEYEKKCGRIFEKCRGIILFLRRISLFHGGIGVKSRAMAPYRRGAAVRMPVSLCGGVVPLVRDAVLLPIVRRGVAWLHGGKRLGRRDAGAEIPTEKLVRTMGLT